MNQVDLVVGGTRMIMLTAVSINLLDSTGDFVGGNTGPVTGGNGNASDHNCRYLLVSYDSWLRKKLEEGLEMPEACYSSCVYERIGGQPG